MEFSKMSVKTKGVNNFEVVISPQIVALFQHIANQLSGEMGVGVETTDAMIAFILAVNAGECSSDVCDTLEDEDYEFLKPRVLEVIEELKSEVAKL